MFNSKFNSLLTALLIIAIIAILAIIGYFGYSIYNKYYLNVGAKDAVDAFEQAVGNQNTVTTPPTNELVQNVVIGGVSEGDSMYQNQTQNNNTSTTTYYGYEVVGTISIPAIDIEYPILGKPATDALKVAIVYLSGAGINQVGNTVLQGHNYRNGLFFSNLSKLSVGDKIYITDKTGTQVTYEVYRNFEAKATDTSFYKRDTEGKREVTLSTSTNDNTVRTIILAREV